MMQKIILILLCLFICIKKGESKDSTVVFTLSIGANISSWATPTNSHQYIGDHGSNYIIDSSYGNKSNISPSANIGMQKNLKTNSKIKTSFFIYEKYYFSSLTYNKNSSGWYLSPPSFTTPTYFNNNENHSLNIHQFSTSIGLKFYVKKFYIAPLKFNANVSSSNEKTTFKSNQSLEKVETKKQNFFLYGFGANAGYNFKLKKLQLFIEYQFDFYKIYSKDLKQLNQSIVLGIIF